MKTNSIPLTKYLQVANGGHILYLFEDVTNYVNNTVSYILTGFEQNHHVLVIDWLSNFQKIYQKLIPLVPRERLQQVHYIDSASFYELHGDFRSQTILTHFNEVLKPFVDDNITIRIWAQVEWREQDNIVGKIQEHECTVDACIQGIGLVGVCAYYIPSVPASLQTILMSSHNYLMTDNELSLSPLYSNSQSQLSVTFPSLAHESSMASVLERLNQTVTESVRRSSMTSKE